MEGHGIRNAGAVGSNPICGSLTEPKEVRGQAVNLSVRGFDSPRSPHLQYKILVWIKARRIRLLFSPLTLSTLERSPLRVGVLRGRGDMALIRLVGFRMKDRSSSNPNPSSYQEPSEDVNTIAL